MAYSAENRPLKEECMAILVPFVGKEYASPIANYLSEVDKGLIFPSKEFEIACADLRNISKTRMQLGIILDQQRTNHIAHSSIV